MKNIRLMPLVALFTGPAVAFASLHEGCAAVHPADTRTIQRRTRSYKPERGSPVGIFLTARTGLSSPVAPDDFSRLRNSGMDYGFGGGFSLGSKVLLLGCFDIHNFALDEVKYRNRKANDIGTQTGAITGGKSRVTTIGGDLRVKPKEGIYSPYFSIGANAYTIEYDAAEIGATILDTATSESVVGIKTGFGFVIEPIKWVSVWTEADIVTGLTAEDPTTFFSVRMGTNLYFLK